MGQPMRRLAKRVAVGSVLAGLLLTSVSASPAAAHPIKNPQPSCSGNQVGHYDTEHRGGVSVFVYYSSANGGTNCVWAQKESKRGTPEAMSLGLGIFEGGDFKRPDWDSGNFEYYAGPVEIRNTAGKCIAVSVEYEDGVDSLGPFHCG